MIDKQKLLQWIEDRREVYSGPYDTETERLHFENKIIVLNALRMDIELGEFDA